MQNEHFENQMQIEKAKKDEFEKEYIKNFKEQDKKTAESKIKEICDELRIYNPMVSKVTVDIFDA